MQKKNLKRKKSFRYSKGITLIALVITIIVLLILAGVTISLTIGENGIFKTAQLAAKNYTNAQEKELADLAEFNNTLNDTIKGEEKIQLVTEITLNKTETNIEMGSTETLTAIISPSNATNKKLKWTSSNENVATVSEGIITAVAEGTTTITAIAQDGSNVQESCIITVLNPLLSVQITPANYGDYVNYEDGLDLGASTYEHETDWRIFYKDSEGYVYLISSYLLPYVQVPSETELQAYNGRPYTAYWAAYSKPTTYTSSAETSYARYMMNFKYNGSYNNGQWNMKCVSQLMNTSVWNTKFKNSTYVEDAIGAPTLEMWVASWNEKSEATRGGYTVLTTSIPNQYGYYVNKKRSIDLSTNTGYNDDLYFPLKNGSDAKGYSYWLSSPSGEGWNLIWFVQETGYMGYACGSNWEVMSARPVVRLKSTVSAIKDKNGIWQLK